MVLERWESIYAEKYMIAPAWGPGNYSDVGGFVVHTIVGPSEQPLGWDSLSPAKIGAAPGSENANRNNQNSIYQPSSLEDGE
jgi:hypothetical protein